MLDRTLAPAPVGVAGELHLAHEGVAAGYSHRPALTAERFVADPHGAPGDRMYRTGDLARFRADGTLEVLGRADQQVKIRGHRVEPGEVEAALLAHPSVAEAAVTAVPAPGGELTLAAYCVPVRAGEEHPRTEGEPAPREGASDADWTGTLRAALAERLPEHLVPGHFVVLDRLPLTPNGKTDRAALPVVADSARARPARAPLPGTETVLCELFAEALGRSGAGPDDDFFLLGGHSLSAARLVTALRSRTGAELPVRAVFDHPTPARLAAVLEKEPTAPSRHGSARRPPGPSARRSPSASGGCGSSPAATARTARTTSRSPSTSPDGSIRPRCVARSRTSPPGTRSCARCCPSRTGEAWQRVLDGGSTGPELREVRVAAADAADRIAAEAARPFDLERETPWRAALFTVEPEPEDVSGGEAGRGDGARAGGRRRVSRYGGPCCSSCTTSPPTNGPCRPCSTTSPPPMRPACAPPLPTCPRRRWTTSTSPSGNGTPWPRTRPWTPPTGAPG